MERKTKQWREARPAKAWQDLDVSDPFFMSSTDSEIGKMATWYEFIITDHGLKENKESCLPICFLVRLFLERHSKDVRKAIMQDRMLEGFILDWVMDMKRKI